MSKKNNPDKNGFVYSTNPDFNFQQKEFDDDKTLSPDQQTLRIKLETKHRAGKIVTLVENFVGSNNDAEEIGKKLKSFCGTGGSVKDNEIIIQGDHRDKILQWLLKNNYKKTRKL